MSTLEYLMTLRFEYMEKTHRDPNALILSYGTYLALEREINEVSIRFPIEKPCTPQFCGCEIIIVEDTEEPKFICRKEIKQ